MEGHSKGFSTDAIVQLHFPSLTTVFLVFPTTFHICKFMPNKLQSTALLRGMALLNETDLTGSDYWGLVLHILDGWK